MYMSWHWRQTYPALQHQFIHPVTT
uniref:Uncharacterized protein n=1 Tax=Anguilla anguilla TaxID=7936 RepID=A0A0E9SSK3_ANGAN